MGDVVPYFPSAVKIPNVSEMIVTSFNWKMHVYWYTFKVVALSDTESGAFGIGDCFFHDFDWLYITIQQIKHMYVYAATRNMFKSALSRRARSLGENQHNRRNNTSSAEDFSCISRITTYGTLWQPLCHEWASSDARHFPFPRKYIRSQKAWLKKFNL